MKGLVMNMRTVISFCVIPLVAAAAGGHLCRRALRATDRWGYIDKTGKMVIAFAFEVASDFSENRAAVRVNDKWGFIDRAGKVVIAARYDRVGLFSSNLAMVEQDGRQGFVDRKGAVVIPLQEARVGRFISNRAAIRLKGDRGFVDRKGHFVIPPSFDGCKPFSGGRAAVGRRTGPHRSQRQCRLQEALFCSSPYRPGSPRSRCEAVDLGRVHLFCFGRRRHKDPGGDDPGQVDDIG